MEADLVLWYLNPQGQHWTLMVLHVKYHSHPELLLKLSSFPLLKVIDPKKKEMKYLDSFLPSTCTYFQSTTIRCVLFIGCNQVRYVYDY